MATVEIEIRITGPVGSRKGTLMQYICRTVAVFGTIIKEVTVHKNEDNRLETSEICIMEVKLDLTRL